MTYDRAGRIRVSRFVHENMESLVTFVVLFATFVIPTYTVWKYPNWKGVLLGALTLWIFLFLAVAFLIGQYGTGGPAGIGLWLWALTGWLWSGGYCFVVVLVSRSRR